MLYDRGEFNNSDLGKTVKDIQERAKRLFNWEPRKGFLKGFFEDREPHPLTDSRISLRDAIKKHINPSARVLTTPIHRPFFEEVGVKDITIYDISPAQLAANPHEKMYWCDVLYPPLLQELLNKTQPGVMYFSNILDYSEGKSSFPELERVINKSSLKVLMLSSGPKLWGEEDSSLEFSKGLKKSGWQLKKYGNENGNIFVTVRK